ncbi:hypothetical protein KO493_06000 [Tamlana agarivorans]|uniref:Uncharacterized protein n=1 Tax=Pseudotamlana agarivorans TaxID=481183 RepID=A0ACC5U7E5_9FLAO|nr:hypothetical protein [Tamlana agarivorans]MBU2950241.1 hypothetical protein [Tamlana agarivorans]
MKIGYFNDTKISISETFVYDLLKGLFKKHGDITYFSGEKETTGFNHETRFLNKLLLKNKTLCKEFGEAGRIHIAQLCNPQKRLHDILKTLNK